MEIRIRRHVNCDPAVNSQCQPHSPAEGAMRHPQMSFRVYLYSYPGQHHRDIPSIHNKHFWVKCLDPLRKRRRGMKNEVDQDLRSQIRMCIRAPEANVMEGGSMGFGCGHSAAHGQVKLAPDMSNHTNNLSCHNVCNNIHNSYTAIPCGQLILSITISRHLALNYAKYSLCVSNWSL